MAEEIKKYKIQQKLVDGNTLTLHPETDGKVVKFEDTTNSLTSENVNDAINEVAQKVATGVVSGVKGDAETTYRKGDVNITKANIGLGNVDNTSDANKPISNATQGALDLKEDKANLKALAYKDSLSKSDVGLGNVTNDAQVKRSEMGVASGVATLDANGLIPSSQLPSYVDDVLEYYGMSYFPTQGEVGKIYVNTKDGKTYRWSGTTYVEISSSLALGETSSTAYAGDKGKANAQNIAEILDGTQTVPKALKDGHGRVISDTYVTKDELTDDYLVDYVDIESNQTITGQKTFDNRINFKGGIDSKDEPVIVNVIEAPQSNGSSTYGKGSANQILKSNGDTIYWDDLPTIPNVEVKSSGTGSFVKDVTSSGHTITKTLGNIANSDLPNSGVTAGTYSAVEVNAKGIVTSGGQMIEVGVVANGTPSSNLAVGGLYFQLLE